VIQNAIEIVFSGQAGDGSLTTGDLIAGVLKRMGREVYTYKDFPSRIRGGHTSYVIRATDAPNRGMADLLDAVVAFDLEAVQAHIDEMRPGGFVIFDNSSETIPAELRRADLNWYEVPLGRIAKDQFKAEIVRNTISLGVLGALIDMDPAVMHGEVEQLWQRKGEKVVAMNLGAVAAGAAYVHEHFAAQPSGYTLTQGVDGDRLLMMGNDAIAYGALAAGCRFIAGYPITPATDILEWLAKYLPRYGGVAVQAEDEIAAIHMTLGAAYSGVRAMTATSGPGQALMTEAIGLAGTLEIPVVIVECARAGPSTGMPTKTEQSNLDHVIFSGHGEIPKVVLSPGTIEESFSLTVAAFNLAERYQLPVFVLTEQALCQSKATLPHIDFSKIAIDRGKIERNGRLASGDYKRFAAAPDGVSPRAIPGTPGGMHLAAGSEHNEAGVVTENAQNRRRMMEKRMGKLDAMRDELPKGNVFGPADAPVAIVGFGANRGPITEAQARLHDHGITTRFLQLVTLWPFPTAEVQAFLAGAREIFVVENNYGGQLERHIRGTVGPLPSLHSVRKYDGRPFRPSEIFEPIARTAGRVVAKELVVR
jgi:2-oxoglutarate ferredoxin oxidoreductase subunit alpha